MNRVLVWDIPTRLFHWLLAGGFICAAIFSLLLGEDSALFPYHAIIGLTLTLMVGLRLIWGFAGTRFARFGSFAYGPGAVIHYMKGVIAGGGTRHLGHNPGSAYAIFAMLALILALGVTGFLMSTGAKGIKDIHEILAYVMVGVVISHILGVAMHTLRFRENITASMIHGSKSSSTAPGIASSHPLVAFIFLAIIAACAFSLIRNFDAATKTTTLPILGTTLTIGEADDEGNGAGRNSRPGQPRGEDND